MLRYSGNTPVVAVDLVKQLSQLYGRGRTHFDVVFPFATQKVNGLDCGVFAIAYAADLCEGIDPAQRLYDQRRLRKHIVSCFRNRRLLAFPGSGTQSPVVCPTKVKAIY